MFETKQLSTKPLLYRRPGYVDMEKEYDKLAQSAPHVP
jgi:hypothetical protein